MDKIKGGIGMALIDFVGGSEYITVSRSLCQKIGPAAAVVYSVLIDKYRFNQKVGKLDDEGMFNTTVDAIKHQTGVGRNQQQSIFRLLTNLGLILQKKKGMPAKRYIKIIKNPQFSE